jgi:hypothetical protein
MSRLPFLLCAVLLAAGCRLTPEREAALKPLPEGLALSYADLLIRARTQATAALEAFYVDHWVELEEAAAGLEQTARLMPKAVPMPAVLKDRVGPEAEQLRQDAVKLGEAARARDVRAANETLQRINLHIRDLRPDEPAPEVKPPPKNG